MLKGGDYRRKKTVDLVPGHLPKRGDERAGAERFLEVMNRSTDKFQWTVGTTNPF